MLGKLRLLFWIGIILLFLPFLGIPLLWKKVLIAIIGAGIVYLSFRIRYAYKKMKFEMRQGSPDIIHG
jgi:hypothetical protein